MGQSNNSPGGIVKWIDACVDWTGQPSSCEESDTLVVAETNRQRDTIKRSPGYNSDVIRSYYLRPI
jgi:hypothetical protein